MEFRTITFAFAAAGAFAAVFAASEARAAKSLTIGDALALARQNNRTLKAAQATLKQSDAAIDRAWAALLPIVNAQGKYTHNNKEVALDLAAQNQGLIGLTDVLVRNAPQGSQAQMDLQQLQAGLNAAAAGEAPVIQNQEQLDATLSATIPLIAPASWYGLSAARRQREAADATYEDAISDVLLRVAQAYYAAAGSDELVKVRQHGIEVAKETLENAKARFQTGMVNRVEVTRAELALLQAEQQEVEAKDARENSLRALKTTLGTEEEITVTPGPDEKPAADVSSEALAKDALARRPDVAQLERAMAANEAQANSALWLWSPTLSAFGNARAFNYAGFSGDKYAWAIGLQLDWLVFDGGARDASRHVAQAQHEENTARLAELEDTIADEIDNAKRATVTRRRALDTAQRSVDLSKETLELVRAQHDAGTATQIDLLQAQDALISAEVSVAQARFDLQLANITLQHAAGTLSAGVTAP